MIEKIGHIKNPLTVIAMFAAIAEVSSAVALPMVKESVQGVYVWFLMLFPCLLVSLFFWTLWKKHTVLYAPSDYQSDDSFLAGFTKVNNAQSLELSQVIQATSDITDNTSSTTQSEGLSEGSFPQQKLRGDRQEYKISTVPVGHYNVDANSRNLVYVRQSLRAAARFNRFRTAIGRLLSSRYDGKWEINMAPKQFPNLKFDIVIESKQQLVVVEVIDENGLVLKASDVRDILDKVEVYYSVLSQEEKNHFLFNLVVVIGEGDPSSDQIDGRKQILQLLTMCPFLASIKYYPEKLLLSL